MTDSSSIYCVLDVTLRRWVDIATAPTMTGCEIVPLVPIAVDSGAEQPMIVRWLNSITKAWHVVVPVVDDVTNVLLLTSTADSRVPCGGSASSRWWWL